MHAYLLFLTRIQSHSWLDCIGLASHEYIGNNQFFSNADFENTCIGYPRSYPGRMNKDINTIFTYAVLDRNPDANVCSDAQLTSSPVVIGAAEEFPTAMVQAGEQLKLWWELDNHLSPETKVSVHWTKNPNSQLEKYSELTDDSIYTEMPFATSESCLDTLNVNSLCWGFMDVPQVEPGTYSFVWVWHWDQNPKGEEYTTCFDLIIS